MVFPSFFNCLQILVLCGLGQIIGPIDEIVDYGNPHLGIITDSGKRNLGRVPLNDGRFFGTDVPAPEERKIVISGKTFKHIYLPAKGNAHSGAEFFAVFAKTDVIFVRRKECLGGILFHFF